MIVVTLLSRPFLNFLLIRLSSRRSTNDAALSKKIEVYNCSTGQQNPLTWSMFRKIGFNVWMQNPTVEMLWYPNCSFTMNDKVFKIDQAVSHYLPAYALDLVARMTGKRVKWVSCPAILDGLNCCSWPTLYPGSFIRSGTSRHFLSGLLHDPSMEIRQQESYPFAGLSVGI